MEIQQPLPAAHAPASESTVRAPMSPHTRSALGVTGAALLLGALGDALLRPTPWGLNVALWTVALVAAAALLQGWADTDDRVRGWMPVALVIAALLAWRDSPTLKGMDLTALALVLGLAVHRARGGTIRLGGLATYAGGLLASFAEAAFGSGLLVSRDVKWGELRRDGWSRHALAVGRGVALALPLLLLFGVLLSAADAAFERLLSTTFRFDLPKTLGHVMLSLVFAWAAGGVLRALVLPGEPVAGRMEGAAAVKRPSLGIVELGTVLGLLDLLFLSFVLVQLPHFFGSSALVEAPGTTTYAEYARRGFFELCAVAGLVLPMLLGAHWLLRKDGRQERVFRVLSGAMVGLVFVMIASGLHRMRLYQTAYGLTELRLYTTAFMLWLTAVFGWFAWTVLRGRRERFAFGALAAALEGLVILHAVNPDALIVRVNATREASIRFDARYAASLSADAVPALLAALPTLPEADRCQAAGQLLRRWDAKQADWRAWSLGRNRALSQVDANAARLAAMECADAAVAPATATTATTSTTTTTTAPAIETAAPGATAGAAPQSAGASTISPPAAAPAERAPGVTAEPIPVAPPAPAGARP